MPYEHAFAGALGAIAMALSPFGMSPATCHEMMDMGQEHDAPDDRDQPMGCHAVYCRRTADGHAKKS